MRGLPRPVPLGQISPRGAGAQLPQDPVDHLPVITPPPPSTSHRRQQRLDPGPCPIGQLTTTYHPGMINDRGQSPYRTRPSRALAVVILVRGSARPTAAGTRPAEDSSRSRAGGRGRPGPDQAAPYLMFDVPARPAIAAGPGARDRDPAGPSGRRRVGGVAALSSEPDFRSIARWG
jgi:hypothetical protein